MLCLACLACQLAAAPLLQVRWQRASSFGPGPPGDNSPPHDPMFDGLAAAESFYQNFFHVLGSLLLLLALGVLFLLSRDGDRWPRDLYCMRPVLLLLLLSDAIWLLWAVQGLRDEVATNHYAGLVGFVAGLVLPLVTAGRLLLLRDRGAKEVWLVVLAALVWVWSLGFALSQFAIGVSA